MVDWPIFVLGLLAVSIVATAVRAVAREDMTVRTARPAAPPREERRA